MNLNPFKKKQELPLQDKVTRARALLEGTPYCVIKVNAIHGIRSKATQLKQLIQRQG